jgi:[histone H3]-trimethyl-L-lysine9/36 demethylase
MKRASSSSTSKAHWNKTSAKRVDVAHAEPGVFDLLLIQRKSMRVADYRKKVIQQDVPAETLESDKVEKDYWRSLNFNPPLYGSDVKGSLFETDSTWNLNQLKGLLSSGLDDARIAGINDPYFYFGAWRTTFAWHCEDLHLPSINYLHYGRPK